MAIVSLSWKALDNLQLKLDGIYRHTSYRGRVSHALNNYSGSLQVNYYWKDFSVSAYGKSTEKYLLDDLTTQFQPMGYGVFAGWSRGNWRVEAGADNFFTKHRRFKNHQEVGPYRWNQVFTGPTYQRTGYVKVAYSFDFGKKTSRDNRNINTNIDSAILKAE